jgi:hypothetical protein
VCNREWRIARLEYPQGVERHAASILALVVAAGARADEGEKVGTKMATSPDSANKEGGCVAATASLSAT